MKQEVKRMCLNANLQRNSSGKKVKELQYIINYVYECFGQYCKLSISYQGRNTHSSNNDWFPFDSARRNSYAQIP